MSNGLATSHASFEPTMLSIATPHHTQDVYPTYPQDQALPPPPPPPTVQQQQQQRLPLLPPPHPHPHSLPLPLPLPAPQQQQQQQQQQQHAQAPPPPPPGHQAAYHLLPNEEPYVFCHYRPATTAMPHRVPSPPRASFPSQDTAAVRQALELARESPDGAQDATICKILEVAITGIWGKVQDQPDAYVMDRDEFAVFNYFQHRFKGDAVAVAARKRYWDHLHA